MKKIFVLLETPATVTVTAAVTDVFGTVATIWVSVQVVVVAVTLPNCKVPEVPNPEPLIVTDVPELPLVGFVDVTTGVTDANVDMAKKNDNTTPIRPFRKKTDTIDPFRDRFICGAFSLLRREWTSRRRETDNNSQCRLLGGAMDAEEARR